MPQGEALDVFSWLDWEETTLREAVLSQDAKGIQHAMQHLETALGSNAYLVGGSLTLADVVIYVGLLPIQVSNSSVTWRLLVTLRKDVRMHTDAQRV